VVHIWKARFGGDKMKLAKELQKYLDRNGFIVDVQGPGLKALVIDRDGKVISTGATVHTAVRKVIWCDTCYCQEHKPRGVRKKTVRFLTDE